ncbi:MAG: hypothetical protein JO197_11445 [Acidobacteria bacterium]|nr:hypothetical protein [Acidobacteriota bacterium]MBV9476090.1 hypothetical protein [Acidobacteriota bacterium]
MKSYKIRLAAACFAAVLSLPAFAAADVPRENPGRDITARLIRIIKQIAKPIGIVAHDDQPQLPRP